MAKKKASSLQADPTLITIQTGANGPEVDNPSVTVSRTGSIKFFNNVTPPTPCVVVFWLKDILNGPVGLGRARAISINATDYSQVLPVKNTAATDDVAKYQIVFKAGSGLPGIGVGVRIQSDSAGQDPEIIIG